jgi:acylphosphatase
VSSILSSIGHSLASSDVSTASSCSIFEHFIDAGLRYTLASLDTPTSEEIIPKLDEWSGAEETVKEFERIQGIINSKRSNDPVQYVSEYLVAKSEFTRTSLKTVCDVISSGYPTIDPKACSADTKTLQARQTYLETLLTKIKSEALELYFKLRQMHIERRTLQRQLEKVTTAAQQAAPPLPTPMPESSSSSSAPEAPITIAIPAPSLSSSSSLAMPVTPVNTADSSSLEIKYSILEKQLSDSEAEIFRMERELSKALAADFLPESSREKYRLDVLSVVKILKDNIDATVSSQRQKIKELSDICNAHKDAIESIQLEAKKQIEHSSSLAANEIKKSQSAVEDLKRELKNAESKVLELDQMRGKVQEYSKLIESFELAEKNFQERVAKFSSEKDTMEMLLLASK